MMEMVKPRTMSKPVSPVVRRRGATIRRTPVQVRVVSPATGVMQATGSLETALRTPMMSLVMTAGVPPRLLSTWRRSIPEY